MHLRVTDVAGNVADQYAAWNGVAQIGSTTFAIIWLVLTNCNDFALTFIVVFLSKLNPTNLGFG